MVVFHRKAAAIDAGAGFQRGIDGHERYYSPKKGWKAQVYALYVVLGLITVRWKHAGASHLPSRCPKC